jgi:NtrC-family two-component system response regulator AlgB
MDLVDLSEPSRLGGLLPPALQPKLLRLLQERCYERVGEAQTRASDVRILAATNHNLEAETAAGTFRED